MVMYFQQTTFTSIITTIFNYSFYQWTPLYVATRKGHEYIVKYLVEKRANINITDKDGVSLTIYTIDATVISKSVSMNLQLFAVRVYFLSLHQRTACDVADERGHTNITQFLRMPGVSAQESTTGSRSVLLILGQPQL